MSTRRILFEYGLDDTVGTWMTCYYITGLTWTFAFILFCKMYRDKHNGTDTKPWSLWHRNSMCILYLILNGISWLFGGITHQFYAHTNDYPNTPSEWYIFYGLKIIFLLSAISVRVHPF